VTLQQYEHSTGFGVAIAVLIFIAMVACLAVAFDVATQAYKSRADLNRTHFEQMSAAGLSAHYDLRRSVWIIYKPNFESTVFKDQGPNIEIKFSVGEMVDILAMHQSLARAIGPALEKPTCWPVYLNHITFAFDATRTYERKLSGSDD